MAHRGDFGATDIARQNAEVLTTVASFLARLMLLTAVVCFSVVTVVELHAHVVIEPNLWVHHLGVGGAAGSLRHVIVMLTVGFIAVTLEAFVLCRDASARREPGAVATVLATARRLLLGVRRAELLIVGSAALRPASSVERDLDSGILRQLRSALSIAPVGPPASLALGLNPWGLFEQSGHRTEVCAAA
ncbi:MAG: hypothetical protein ACLQVI_00110 [Polyangiaceae bacterium]